MSGSFALTRCKKNFIESEYAAFYSKVKNTVLNKVNSEFKLTISFYRT